MLFSKKNQLLGAFKEDAVNRTSVLEENKVICFNKATGSVSANLAVI